MDRSIFWQKQMDAAEARADALRADAARLREALRLLVQDVQDYEAWRRPCYALEVAIRALAGKEGG